MKIRISSLLQPLFLIDRFVDFRVAVAIALRCVALHCVAINRGGREGRDSKRRGKGEGKAKAKAMAKTPTVEVMIPKKETPKKKPRLC